VTRLKLTRRQRTTLLRGKARRLYLGIFRRRYVRQSVARRRGECRRCGACCKLGFRCCLLRDNGAVSECLLHRLRPPSCRLFPIDERDLADRDLVEPEVPCGYRFEREDDGAEEQ